MPPKARLCVRAHSVRHDRADGLRQQLLQSSQLRSQDVPVAVPKDTRDWDSHTVGIFLSVAIRKRDNFRSAMQQLLKQPLQHSKVKDAWTGTCDAARDEVFAAIAEAIGHQGFADGFGGVSQASRLPKGSTIVEVAAEHASLAAHELNHLANSHTGGEAMGVHDQVRADPHLGEGHVLLGNDGAHHPLLPMPATELVPKLWPASVPHQHLHKACETRQPCVS